LTNYHNMKFSLHANTARTKMESGNVLHAYSTGNFASPRHIDFIARSGCFDMIWFDLEHFDIPLGDLAVMDMVAKAASIATITRFKASSYDVVMRVLETGTDSIMCAMVADADEAGRIVSWAKYCEPDGGFPNGRRGWNGGNADAVYGQIPAAEYIRHRNSQTMILCQIEHASAVEQAEAIAAIHGVDALFFGPGDYAVSIGLPGQINHPKVYEAMEKVAAAAKRQGKWWGTVGIGHEMYAQVKQLGARLICPGGDVRIMSLGLRALMESFSAGQ